MISTLVKFLQRLVSSDKAVVVAVIVNAAVALVARFGLHLSGNYVAIVAAVVAAVLGAFVHANVSARVRAAKAA